MYEFFEFIRAIWILPTFLIIVVSIILLTALYGSQSYSNRVGLYDY